MRSPRCGYILLLATVAAAPATRPVAKVEPFDLDEVALLDSPLRSAQQLNADYLLSLDPDRFLHYFRTEAGLRPLAPAYGGWESPDEGAGRCLGHYLSALSAQYRVTSDIRFRARAAHIVDELAACQAANGNGYLGAERDGKAFWADLAAGHADALRKHRVPWYVQHKLFAGLRDAYQLAGLDPARDVLVRLSDWAIGVTAKLDDAAFQQMLEQEHGGMREVLADVYAITGDAKYLTLANRFDHRRVTDPLAAGTDALAGLHANTQVAKVVGAARSYELTGDDRDRRVAETFWHAVAEHRSYANGGNSDGERFGQPDALTLGTTTSETCNTYNLLKLTRHLIGWDPRPIYGDYYERAIYNHLLAAVGPGPGNFCYYTPTAGGHARAFSRPTDSFWCCVGTGMENPPQYAAGIYFHDDRDLTVNLFVPSRLIWRDHGLTATLVTRYPSDGHVALFLTVPKPMAMAVRLRVPAWAGPGVRLRVNDAPVMTDAKPGAYAVIDRTWADGDRVEMDIPLRLRTELLPGSAHRVAVFYGPLLLAGKLPAIEPAAQLLGDSPAIPKGIATVAPLAVGDRPVDAWVRPVAGVPGTFRTHDVGLAADVDLVPLYQLGASRYCMYWTLGDVPR